MIFIFIFKALVEYNDISSARHAKRALQDQDIYSDCCRITVEFARTPRLNVYRVRFLPQIFVYSHAGGLSLVRP